MGRVGVLLGYNFRTWRPPPDRPLGPGSSWGTPAKKGGRTDERKAKGKRGKIPVRNVLEADVTQPGLNLPLCRSAPSSPEVEGYPRSKGIRKKSPDARGPDK